MASYGHLKVEDLKHLLRERGASLKGKKKDLVERLKLYDERNNFCTKNVCTDDTPKCMFTPEKHKFKDINASTELPPVTMVNIEHFLNRYKWGKMGFLWELWSGLVEIARYIAAFIAVAQAMLCCLIFLYGSCFVLYIGNAVDKLTNSQAMQIADLILGMELSESIQDVSGFFKAIVIGTLLAIFIICILLCKGLCEKKPWFIMVYFIIGVITFGFRASLLTDINFVDSYDKASRSVGSYGMYLLTLFIIAVQLLVEQRQKSKGVIINNF